MADKLGASCHEMADNICYSIVLCFHKDRARRVYFSSPSGIHPDIPESHCSPSVFFLFIKISIASLCLALLLLFSVTTLQPHGFVWCSLVLFSGTLFILFCFQLLQKRECTVRQAFWNRCVFLPLVIEKAPDLEGCHHFPFHTRRRRCPVLSPHGQAQQASVPSMKKIPGCSVLSTASIFFLSIHGTLHWFIASFLCAQFFRKSKFRFIFQYIPLGLVLPNAIQHVTDGLYLGFVHKIWHCMFICVGPLHKIMHSELLQTRAQE